MNALEKISSIDNPTSMDGQLLVEAEFQKYFKKTPPLVITSEFRQLSGSVDNQISILNLALKVIEELDVEPVQAYGLLEAVRPVIYEKFKILTSRFIGKTLISRTKTNEVVFNAIDLYTRLTATYDSVIEEARYFGDSQAFIMGSAIHRAMSDKAKLIQCYLLLYMEIPEQIWKHLNSLYLTADEFNIQNQVNSDTLLLADNQLSIRQLYTFALLLSTCEMKNLHVSDIQAVGELLKSLIKTVVIKPRVVVDNTLYMDPTLIAKPERYREGISKKSDKAFSFDLKGLEKTFTKKYHTQIMVETERYTLSPVLLDRIYQQWTGAFVRAEDRSAERHFVVARLGFMPNWAAANISQDAIDEDANTQRDYRGLKLDLNPTLESLPLTALAPVEGNTQGVHEPVMIDWSAHGFGLSWSNAFASLIQVGELVVVHDVEFSSQQLCQILWVKSVDKDMIKTGLRVLATTTIPVLVKPIKSVGLAPGKIVKGFLLASTHGDKNSYSIIVERSPLMTGSIIVVSQGQATRSMQLLEQYSINQHYQLFSVGFYSDVTTV